METGATLEGLKSAVLEAGSRIAVYLPQFLAALLVLVAGFVIARLGRRAARRGADLANRLLDRVVPRGAAARVRVSPATITVVGELTFWIVFVFALLIAGQVAGFPAVTLWLGEIVRHLPNLIVGVAIVIVGYFLSIFARELTRRKGEEGAGAQLLGRTVQLGVITIAVVIGLDQVGIDVAVLIVLVAIAAAGVLGGLLVAFGYGARQHVRNLIGVKNARQSLHAGLRVRLADAEGEILEITPTHIALDTAEGKLLVPAARFDEHPVLILTDLPEEGSADG